MSNSETRSLALKRLEGCVTPGPGCGISAGAIASCYAAYRFSPEIIRPAIGCRRRCKNFSSVHARAHNHFNQERHLATRQVFKQRHLAALIEWRALPA
jgi:hypothetical protein